MSIVFIIITFISLLDHAQSLRFFTVRAQKSHRNLALFQSKTSLETFASYYDKNFEASWSACKKRMDLDSILVRGRMPYIGDVKLGGSIELHTIRENEKFDAKVVCSDKPMQPLYAHRSTLSDSSLVFSAFVVPFNVGDAEFAMIELRDVDMEVGKELLLFMYSREFSEEDFKVFTKKGMGEGLLRAALKYKVTDLVEFFDSVLSKLVNNDNAVALHFLAKSFELERLKASCKEHLENDPAIVLQELKAYALKGIAGEEVKGQPAKPAPALKENADGYVDKGGKEEDVNNEVDYDSDSDE